MAYLKEPRIQQSQNLPEMQDVLKAVFALLQSDVFNGFERGRSRSELEKTRPKSGMRRVRIDYAYSQLVGTVQMLGARLRKMNDDGLNQMQNQPDGKESRNQMRYRKQLQKTPAKNLVQQL